MRAAASALAPVSEIWFPPAGRGQKEGWDRRGRRKGAATHTHTHTGTERQLPKKVSVCKGPDAQTPHIRSRKRD